MIGTEWERLQYRPVPAKLNPDARRLEWVRSCCLTMVVDAVNFHHASLMQRHNYRHVENDPVVEWVRACVKEAKELHNPAYIGLQDMNGLLRDVMRRRGHENGGTGFGPMNMGAYLWYSVAGYDADDSFEAASCLECPAAWLLHFTKRPVEWKKQWDDGVAVKAAVKKLQYRARHERQEHMPDALLYDKWMLTCLEWLFDSGYRAKWILSDYIVINEFDDIVPSNPIRHAEIYALYLAKSLKTERDRNALGRWTNGNLPPQMIAVSDDWVNHVETLYVYGRIFTEMGTLRQALLYSKGGKTANCVSQACAIYADSDEETIKAAVTWVLVAKKMGLHKDARRQIAIALWKDRSEWCRWKRDRLNQAFIATYVEAQRAPPPENIKDRLRKRQKKKNEG